MAAADNDISVNLLGGRHVSYAKLFDRWWEPIQRTLAAHDLAGRPVYFVSSNLHSLVNLVSGYAARRARAGQRGEHPVLRGAAVAPLLSGGHGEGGPDARGGGARHPARLPGR